MPGRGSWLGVLILVAWCCFAQASFVFAADTVSLAPNLSEARSLAVSANGQMVLSIDGTHQAILAGDPSEGVAWRDVVSSAGNELPKPVAVGCLPGDVVAAVCRKGDDWTLRTFRVLPATAADPREPLQVIQLGTASGDGEGVAIAVHHARGWLVVTGLPAPLPPVLRAAIAGVGIGPLSDRSCPVLPDGCRPVAVAISPPGDVVLALRSLEGHDTIAFYDTGGREILRLPTGLRRVTGIDFGRGDRLLWALGEGHDGQSGLWQLDAAFQDGRQVIEPAFVQALSSPVAIASASERVIIVIHSESPRILSRLDSSTTKPPAPKEPSP